MKFKIGRAKFIEVLKTVQNIVVGKGSLPVLQNVLLEAEGENLRLTTTDLDMSIRVNCKCTCEEAGKTTLPVKLLFNAMSKVAEGEISVTVDAQDKAVIEAGNARYKFTGLPEIDFPKLPQDDEAYAYTLAQVTFREMLRKVSYASSQDDTRRTLKGVLLSFKDSKLTMVATDGRRLALVENEVEFPKNAERDIVLPSKAVAELQRTLTGDVEVEMLVQKSQICFKIGETLIYSKLIEDPYPNYKQVIPKELNEKIEIDRQSLLNALDRASVMSVDEAHSTRLSFENGKLTVSSAATEIGEAKDVVPVKYAGERIDIMFNPNYVMDALKAIDEDEISIHLNDGHSPALIKCGIPFLYVLMPLRTNG